VSKSIDKMQTKIKEYQEMIPVLTKALNEWKNKHLEARKKIQADSNEDKIKQYEDSSDRLHTIYFNSNDKVRSFDEILVDYVPFSSNIGGTSRREAIHFPWKDINYYKYMNYKAKYKKLKNTNQ